MEVHYQGHVFEFEPAPDQEFVGRLVLDDRRRELLVALSAAEEEGWYLDDGERLPADELFARTPWSYHGPDGPVKLLCPFLNSDTGAVTFHTPELYGGDLFRWMRPDGDAADAG